jgi:hypothetical protein
MLLIFAALATLCAAGFAVAWLRGLFVIRRLETQLPECDLATLLAANIVEMRDGIMELKAHLLRAGSEAEIASSEDG